MKKYYVTLITGLIFILLLSGCTDRGEEITTTTIITKATTTLPPTTTTTKQTTTTTTTTRITTTTSTTTTLKTAPEREMDAQCDDYCKLSGFNAGVCRLNRFECVRRIEGTTDPQRRLCTDMRYDTCCCITDESLEKDNSIKWNYSINT